MLSKKLGLLAIFSGALVTSGCQSGTVQSLGEISVGDSAPQGSDFSTGGAQLEAWICDGRTITVSSTSTPSECIGQKDYTVVFRDKSWVYGVEIKNETVTEISKRSRAEWP